MVKANVSTDLELCKVTAEGELDISNLTNLKTPLNELLDSQVLQNGLIIDLHKVTYIDSAVLEVIVRTRNHLYKDKMSLQVITRRDSQPDRVLRTCRFDTILDLHSLNSSPAPTPS